MVTWVTTTSMLSFPVHDSVLMFNGNSDYLLIPLTNIFSSRWHQMLRGLNGFLEAWTLLGYRKLRPDPRGGLSSDRKGYFPSFLGDIADWHFLQDSVKRHFSNKKLNDEVRYGWM